ncbi:M23 family metallopeptidase [Xanthomonas sp. AmX2]|uniref:M23 family metallopeptidase n=1 Tax=Xanthomonas sp. TaxID=29446 RepID=UPI00197F5139|nr:M23 family metallopeptidase [Xanthomonas sp.]MBN6149908.1 M23 family metallopeptidase [Xanthomonas sp.]
MHNTDQERIRKERFQQRLHVQHDTALHRKLRQHLPAAFNERWNRRHWIHASLFATIGALAATIVPGFSNAIDVPLQTTHATLALPLPPLSLAQQQGMVGDSWQVVRIRPGQTLGAVFEQLDIPATLMHQVLGHPGTRDALTRLRPGAEIAFDLPVGGGLRALRFDRDATHRVELTLHGDEVQEKVIERDTSTRTVVTSGQITSSLYAAARKAGLPPSAIATMTDEIFKYDIDFDKDLQPGDRFSVVMDETWREGERIDTSKILAATFTTGGKTYSGFRFERSGKAAEYFDVNGRPLKKTFIRMPVAYSRISSTFGARRHPVLGTMRMHKGIDYAASSGTPIMAAGDARVQYVGTQRGYGNVVILDHGKGYSTLYGHMSRFGKIKAGQRIDQGTVIGYVGMTGLATGPHLHYEFRVAGVQRNPASVTMPPPEPLGGAELVAFRAQTSPALARIQSVEKLIYADAGAADKKKAVASAKPAARG